MTVQDEKTLDEYVLRVFHGETLSQAEKKEFSWLCKQWEGEHQDAREFPYFT